MGKAVVATDFNKIITEGRERKKNQALAERIFSKDRRQSAPGKTTKLGAGPSLASRVGVKKRASLGPSKPVPAGNIDGDWTHDLHNTVNGGGSLAARAGPNAPRATARRADRRAEQRVNRLASALEKEDIVMNHDRAAPAATRGLSIRGLAGPFAVMAQNFAPGTTTADIESAMTPVGGEMVSCSILKTSPMIVVEMVFSSKEGGEAVISTFNNQTADGRIIKVYPKPGGYKEQAAAQRRSTRQQGDNVVDGSHGFSGDLMDADQSRQNNSNGRLYSDRLVGGGGNAGNTNGNGRRGRGQGRGRGR